MKLFFREYGEGEPLIIVHGLFGMSDNWMPVAEKLSGKFKVYLPDMRNHGNSPHSNEHTYKDMSKDLLEFIEDKNIRKANFIGHSMGGKTVLQFAADFPERVSKMIIADISPAEYIPDENFFKKSLNHEFLLKKLLKINISEIKTRKELSFVLKENFENDFLFNLVAKNIRRNPETKKFEYKININALLSNLEEMRKEIRLTDKMKDIEIMFVFGGKSPYLRETDKKYIEKYLPKSGIKIIKDTGHMIHTEQTQKFTDIVLSFF